MVGGVEVVAGRGGSERGGIGEVGERDAVGNDFGDGLGGVQFDLPEALSGLAGVGADSAADGDGDGVARFLSGDGGGGEFMGAVAVRCAVVIVDGAGGLGSAIDAQGALGAIVELAGLDIGSEWRDRVVAVEGRDLGEWRGPVGGDGAVDGLAGPKVDPVAGGEVDGAGG
jgi:hypothetical protein